MADPRGKLALDIVTPQGVSLSTQADEVTASGVLGEFGVFPGHLPMLSALKPGPFAFKRQGEAFKTTLGAGYAEVGPDRVVVLVNTFERGEFFALRALLDWTTTYEPEPFRNALARADARLRELEAQGQDKGEEGQDLARLVAQARARLEKR
jgi:ATP synthase F1 epsilon subunit